jgi:transglutaminase-like putative cysteine protease
MLLQVRHETSYRYTPPVHTARHVAHLRPRATATQQVLSHRLEIAPEPVQRSDGQDGYGNAVAFFSLRGAHDALRVTAESIVATQAAARVGDAAPWETVRDRLRYRRDGRWEPAAEFAFASPQVPRDARFAAYAAPSFAPGRPLLEATHELMRRIHEDFEYRTAATDVGTPALEALRLRQGVCQDFAHVMLGCLRSIGLAARYVSGYLLTAPPPGETRLVGSDASHAWVSVHVPGTPGAWVDVDPTNCRAPGEDYVTVAFGRDYGDVSPLRGVIRGGGRHELRVAVTVTPVAAPTIPGLSKESP